MESLHPPYLIYLLIAWGVITALFIVILIWRSLLTNKEDDQIFLDAAEEHMAAEQRALVARITALSKPLMVTGIVSGLLILVIVGLWLYEGLKSF
jgi:uncharacterized membrane protein